MAYTLKQNAAGIYVLDTQDEFKSTPSTNTSFEAYTPQKTELVGGTDLAEQTKKIMREMPGELQTITDPKTGEVKTVTKGGGEVEVESKPITSLQTTTGEAIQPKETALDKVSRISKMFPSSTSGTGYDPQQYIDRLQQIQKDQAKSQLINTVVSKGLDLGIGYLLNSGSSQMPGGAISFGTQLSGGAYGSGGGFFGTGSGTATPSIGGNAFLAAGQNLLQTGDIGSAAKTGAGAYVGGTIGTAVGGPIGGAIGSTIGAAIGGRIICSELYRQGLISKQDYILDLEFTQSHLTPEHVKGYWYFAIPAVKSMRKSKLATSFWKHIALNRIKDIKWRLGKGKFNLLGRIYSLGFESFCKITGKFVSKKDYHKELYI